MFELLVVCAVLAGFWLLGSALALVFKLVFGLVGGIFALLGGAVGLLLGALALLLVVPVMALALLPVWLPLALLAALVWIVVRVARRPQPVVADPH